MVGCAGAWASAAWGRPSATAERTVRTTSDIRDVETVIAAYPVRFVRGEARTLCARSDLPKPLSCLLERLVPLRETEAQHRRSLGRMQERRGRDRRHPLL